ncbi:MAG: hypothetical protein FJY98_04675 [Candidatus Liptonbacteria bacterium]|nr:hypothetical protein [Candidatus Liptonbacteria bacterium]
MEYIQKRSGLVSSEIKLDLQDTGFSYSSTDKPLIGKPQDSQLFFSYSEIGNSKEYQSTVHPFAKKLYLYAAVIFFAVYVAVLLGIWKDKRTENSTDRALVWIPAILLIVGYRFLIKEKRIFVKTTSGGFLSVFDTKEGANIIKEIYKKRDAYLRKKYIEDKEVKKTLTLETLEYFRSLGIISIDEFEEIKAQNEKKVEGGNIGFAS